MLRYLLLLSALVLSACASGKDLDEAPVPLGDFQLSHNVVVAPDPTKGPLSREASKDDLIASVRDAVGKRFGRYDSDKLYHFGISVEGYVLAQPGIPIVLSPKSALILLVTVWDDAAQKKLNEKPHQVVVVESFSAKTIFGSGLTQTAEEQLETCRGLRPNRSRSGWCVKCAKKAGLAAKLRIRTPQKRQLRHQPGQSRWHRQRQRVTPPPRRRPKADRPTRLIVQTTLDFSLPRQ